jgi:hypothetical protein
MYGPYLWHVHIFFTSTRGVEKGRQLLELEAKNALPPQEFEDKQALMMLVNSVYLVFRLVGLYGIVYNVRKIIYFLNSTPILSLTIHILYLSEKRAHHNSFHPVTNLYFSCELHVCFQNFQNQY